MAVGVQSDMATPALARHGSDTLRREFLAPAIAGEMVVSIGVSEAGAGLDVASIRTHARREGGDYVINGSKIGLPTARRPTGSACSATPRTAGTQEQIADHRTVTRRQRQTPGARNPEDPVPHVVKLGHRATVFDNLRVPVANRDWRGDGFIYQMQQFQQERLNAAARRLAALGADRADRSLPARAPGL